MADRQFNPGDRVMYKGGKLFECGIVIHSWINKDGIEDCYVAFFGEGVFFPQPTDQPILKPYVLRYYANSLEKVAEAPTLAGRIAELEQLWLPCDQTIQCAICGWIDWEDSRHPTECPLGYMEAQHKKTATKAKLVETVPVEHLHGELVSVCRDDCPGCAWERERDALEEP